MGPNQVSGLPPIPEKIEIPLGWKEGIFSKQTMTQE